MKALAAVSWSGMAPTSTLSATSRNANLGTSCAGASVACSHEQTLVSPNLGINQNYYTFALIVLTKIVLCGKFP